MWKHRKTSQFIILSSKLIEIRYWRQTWILKGRYRIIMFRCATGVRKKQVGLRIEPRTSRTTDKFFRVTQTATFLPLFFSSPRSQQGNIAQIPSDGHYTWLPRCQSITAEGHTGRVEPGTICTIDDCSKTELPRSLLPVTRRWSSIIVSQSSIIITLHVFFTYFPALILVYSWWTCAVISKNIHQLVC